MVYFYQKASQASRQAGGIATVGRYYKAPCAGRVVIHRIKCGRPHRGSRRSRPSLKRRQTAGERARRVLAAIVPVEAAGKLEPPKHRGRVTFLSSSEPVVDPFCGRFLAEASFTQANTKRNVLSNASYGLTCTKDVEYKRGSVNYSSLQQERNYLQRSVSADNVVVRSRGYKPSDRHDPVKRNFLENLTSRILHFGMESGETTPINLQKLLTPASDSHEIMQSKNRKMFASSYFYAPTHPTVEDQVELARRISHSLSDVKNVKSKGQTMYVNRKKRSVKWIHDGNGVEDEEESTTPAHKDKLPLKCVMNPCGKVLDIHGIQALGEEVNIASVPKNPEKLFDIVRDLNNQRGRGAEIFAKRRKRSEKWVVDQEQPQTPSTPATPKTPIYPEKPEINGNAKFMTPTLSTPRTPVSTNIDKSFYNPFTVDISLDNANLPITGNKLYENNNYTGPKLASLHNLTNYNTAPRGWDQSLTFYRPIKFEKPQEIVYSDF